MCPFTLTADMTGILQACQAHVMPVHPMCHGDSPGLPDMPLLLLGIVYLIVL